MVCHGWAEGRGSLANIDFAHLKSVLQYLHVTVSPPKCQAFKYDFYTYSLHKPGKIVFFFGFHFPICKRVNNVATTEHIVKCTEKSQSYAARGEGRVYWVISVFLPTLLHIHHSGTRIPA